MFGVLANLICMAFYLIGPFMGYGTKMEPFGALGIAAVWGIYGGIYFVAVEQGDRAFNPGHSPGGGLIGLYSKIASMSGAGRAKPARFRLYGRLRVQFMWKPSPLASRRFQ